MNSPESAVPVAEQYLVEGPVDLRNFNAQRRAGEAAIAALPEGDATRAAAIAINFAQLRVANSLTVALMIAWFRLAQRRGCEVRFTHLPPSLQQVVAFSGLGDVLPIDSDGAGTDRQPS